MKRKSFIYITYSNKQEAKHLVEEAIIEIGHVTHSFSKISVVVVELTLPLAIGDHILVKGPSTDFEQTVDSMEIEHKAITRAEGGQSIGLKVVQPAREKDTVYKKL
jgi:putative protease